MNKNTIGLSRIYSRIYLRADFESTRTLHLLKRDEQQTGGAQGANPTIMPITPRPKP